MQIPVERAHERNKPRYRPNFAPLEQPAENTEALLRTDEVGEHFRIVFLGRQERRVEKVQENGR